VRAVTAEEPGQRASTKRAKELEDGLPEAFGALLLGLGEGIAPSGESADSSMGSSV